MVRIVFTVYPIYLNTKEEFLQCRLDDYSFINVAAH